MTFQAALRPVSTIRKSRSFAQCNTDYIGLWLIAERLEDRILLSGITNLASFNSTNGSNPVAGVILDGTGNLFGTTNSGGLNSNGTVFELLNGNSTITTVAPLSGSGAANIQDPLVMDSAGDLFGTTWAGGLSGIGAVFEIVKGSNAITVLASFDGTDGSHPYAGLTLDASGDLYGVTSAGGTNSDGTIFEIVNGSKTITPLVSFVKATDGYYTSAGLLLDGAGNLYGAASGGGADSDGTVFELTNGSHTITTLAPFDGTDGDYPNGTLVADAAGDLYGTTEIGGANGDGVVFEVVKNSNTITPIASFDSTDGANPYAGLTIDDNGNLFGTAWTGGANGDGTVFEVVNGSNSITTLDSFDGSNGKNPVGGVVMDSSGNLYGTTAKGGANGVGNVFEYIPAPQGFPQYSIMEIPGIVGETPNGINDSGQVVGFSSATDNAALYGNGTITELGTLGGTAAFGGMSSQALGINDAATVTGSAYLPNGSFHAYSYTSSSGMLDIGTLGGPNSIGYGINDSGQVVGRANAGAQPGIFDAFVYTPGTGMTDIGTLGYPQSQAEAINKSGTVVGQAFDVNAGNTAFIYENGVMQALPSLGGSDSDAEAINNNGEAVGSATNASGFTHAVAYLPVGGITDIGALIGETDSSYALSINDSGDVVGNYIGTGGVSSAFIYHDGVTADLNSLIPSGGFQLEVASAVNNEGQILAVGTHNGVQAAFVLTRAPTTAPVLPAPLNVQASSGTFIDHVHISWDAVPDAASYELWRSTTDDTATATRFPINISGTSYDDSSAAPGTSYFYWVRADGATGTSSDFSLSGSGSGSVAIAAPSPTALTLAYLSEYVYLNDPLGYPGYNFVATPSTLIPGFSVDPGFGAAAWLSDDGSQVVVAFRGTDASDDTMTAIKNAAADLSFVGSTVSPVLSNYVLAGLKFINAVQTEFPGATMTLTGHSLGGAIAQLSGAALGRRTVAFDAPGSGQLLPSLFPGVAPATGSSTNYRIYGEQISLIGTSIGSQITLPDPTHLSSEFTIGNDPVENVKDNLPQIVGLHSLENIVADLDGLSPPPPLTSTAGQPDVAAGFEQIVDPTSVADFNLIQSLSLVDVADLDIANIAANTGNLIDPAGGSDFVFLAQSGSPAFESISLPALTGITSYSFRAESQGVWSDFQEIQPNVLETVGTDISGIEFEPLDGNGRVVPLADSFLFDATFATAGSFAGTLATVPSSAVVLPPVSENDSYSGSENQALTVGAAHGVLVNDSDPNGLSLCASLIAGPADGSLSLNSDGSFSYIPKLGFFGADSFTYLDENGTSVLSEPTTVALTVAPITPVVTLNTANLSNTAPSIVISGVGFDPTVGNNTVSFNDGAIGSVTAASTTSLTVTFSTQSTSAGTLTAIVTSDSQSSAPPVQVATITVAAPAAPVVTSSTTSLPANATGITITGTGFDTTAGNNTVAFNDGAVGTVTTATATSLTVTFSTKPTTAGNLTVIDTTDGQNSGTAVQVATVTPVVTLSTASLANSTPSIVINGFGFDPTAGNNTIVLNNGAVGTVTAATATSLTVTFSNEPTGAGSLTVVDTTDNQSSGAAVQVATVTVPSAGGGSLTGQSTIAASSYNLTTLGTSDWAHWGRGGVSGNFDHKSSGGSQISNVTTVGAGGNYGGYAEPARNATWTDGTLTQSDTNEHGYIWANGALNTGYTFTVPADTTSRTLEIYAGGINTTSSITAQLSDGSASPYVATASGTGLYTNFYTITFQAAAANQTLTITLLKTGNLGGVTNGSADLIAAALIRPAVSTPPSVTVNPASHAVTVGNDASFTAAATGGPAPTVQWFVEAPGATTFTPISGATSATLDLGAATLAENGNKYRVVFHNTSGPDAITTAATLTVKAATTGSLIGSHVTAASSYNLTTLGTTDWAHWGTGNSATAFDHKASGGSQISNVTKLGSGKYGSYYSSSRSVRWTGGTPHASNTADHAYLWANSALGAGYSFTVPAGTATHTLYVYAGGYSSGGTLTAHLSNGSAADYVVTASGTGLYTNFYTITFKAASAGQTLKISYVKSTNINGAGGSVDLIAAALV